MASRIEDYAIIADTQTAALVARNGSIDWLCLPRFDSGACFAALLGDESHGRWLLRPDCDVQEVQRSYRGESLVLETTYVTDRGTVRIVDCMPVRDRTADVLRLVQGIEGEVPIHMELRVRFDYGRTVPWVHRHDTQVSLVGGPDALSLRTPVETRGEDLTTFADFTVGPGEEVPFLLSWHPSTEEEPRPVDVAEAADRTAAWWQEWASVCSYDGPHRDLVIRSLLTLKALTFAPTGGLVAAATTSLPEFLGGVRNWDYRYCWIRDATITLYALMSAGYTEEADAWDNWLFRAVAGSPEQMQIMYGVAGERMLPEIELGWLEGYEGSTPVRIGNAAADQFQLDVYGEIMDCFFQARRTGVEIDDYAWHVERALLDFLEDAWRQPDEGIWEVRGRRRHFTHSKVMAWVAFDRAVKNVEQFHLDGPADRWRAIRDEIHAEVCDKGFDPRRGTFTQFYGSRQLDAAVLMIPLVGFLPATDERMLGTVEAIQKELCVDGFVQRYSECESPEVDGLPSGEAAFIPCTFWLVDNLHLQGRGKEAEALFDHVCAVANDVGLLSEEYEPGSGRLLGNFPQAFSHLALVNSALNLSRDVSPARHRGDVRD